MVSCETEALSIKHCGKAMRSTTPATQRGIKQFFPHLIQRHPPNALRPKGVLPNIFSTLNFEETRMFQDPRFEAQPTCVRRVTENSCYITPPNPYERKVIVKTQIDFIGHPLVISPHSFYNLEFKQKDHGFSKRTASCEHAA